MTDVTRILSRIEAGDANATDQLLPVVYDELRKLAAARMSSERTDHTLSATGLVHEAYVRLVDEEVGKRWANRAQFFKAASEAMRRILIESIRRKRSEKRGGEFMRAVEVPVDLPYGSDVSPDLILDVNDQLERLEAENPAIAELVKLRVFGGLSITEAGQALGLPRSTAYDHWRYARARFELSLASGEAY